jgi:hypothetical protein
MQVSQPMQLMLTNQKVSLFMCRRNKSHVSKNKESFNDRQDHMEPIYVLHRDKNNYIPKIKYMWSACLLSTRVS